MTVRGRVSSEAQTPWASPYEHLLTTRENAAQMGAELLIRDVLHAVRALRRSPLFTAVVAITMALGIGASTELFSVANAVLLRPLPYVAPDRLVVMYMDLRARNNFAMPSRTRTSPISAMGRAARSRTWRRCVPRGW